MKKFEKPYLILIGIIIVSVGWYFSDIPNIIMIPAIILYTIVLLILSYKFEK